MEKHENADSHVEKDSSGKLEIHGATKQLTHPMGCCDLKLDSED